MNDERKGTWRDWPTAVIVIGVVLWLWVAMTGGTPSVVVYLVLAFGALALLIRRGDLTPRK